MSPFLFLSRHLACLLCVTLATPALAQSEAATVLDCTGPFARTADERTLARVFGAANVERAAIPVGEGNTEPGTVIFARDPTKRIDILWHDSYARPNVVIIRNGSTWPVAVTGLDRPVTNGATLAEIEAMNGKPFSDASGQARRHRDRTGLAAVAAPSSFTSPSYGGRPGGGEQGDDSRAGERSEAVAFPPPALRGTSPV